MYRQLEKRFGGHSPAVSRYTLFQKFGKRGRYRVSLLRPTDEEFGQPIRRNSRKRKSACGMHVPLGACLAVAELPWAGFVTGSGN